MPATASTGANTTWHPERSRPSTTATTITTLYRHHHRHRPPFSSGNIHTHRHRVINSALRLPIFPSVDLEGEDVVAQLPLQQQQQEEDGVLIPPESSLQSLHQSTTAGRNTETVFFAACLATFMAAIGRASFSVLSVPIQQSYGLTLSQVGMAQSAMLLGYLIFQVRRTKGYIYISTTTTCLLNAITIEQIPTGLLADRVGGARALCAGLIAWSIALAALATAPLATSPFTIILGARAALGAAQAVMMPGVSAAAAQFFPPSIRASKTSSVYAFYSLGTVMGLGSTPIIARLTHSELVVPFLLFGGVGAVLGAMALRLLPNLPPSYIQRQYNPTTSNKTKTRKSIDRSMVVRNLPQILLLCWTHGVIGFGFFVLQAWVPIFLYSLGGSHSATLDLATLGILSALPWMFTAAIAALAGNAADWLQSSAQWSPLRVRRCMQSVASIGGALSFAPLALTSSATLSPLSATVALCMAVAAQGFYYGGFHAYVGDVASQDAGVVLGMTNSFSIVAGIVGNVVAGALAGQTGFQAVFGLAMVLHGVSAATWLIFARGRRIELRV